MSPQTNGRYEGRFAASKRKAARRITGGVLALVVLLLSLVRLGTEAFKLLAYADVFIGGGRMLIYGQVEQVDMGEEINGVPIYTGVPDETLPDDYILRLDNGTTIVYQGHTYELNKNLSTVLFLGIDHPIEGEKVIGNGGQSDVILLIGIDTATGQTTVLNITREAYAQIDVYSVDNQWVETRFGQITLAYAYGDGKQSSCENAVRSVSRLLYGLPISSYIALDLDGIMAVNEAVGGVTVEALEELDLPGGRVLRPGERIELHGKDLDRYIRSRGTGVESNAARMERQKQYVTEFAKVVVSKSRSDLSFPVELFSAVAPYMVTNLEIPDVAFLSSTFLSHGASFSLRDIDGSYDMLGDNAVYYLDETDLFEAVLELFYTQVD